MSCPAQDNAHWTVSDETLLINCLIEHKASAGDGGNFKKPTFTAVAEVVEPKRTKGGPKTAKTCQNKWNALRRTFRAIQAIKAKSGWTWSDETGASITPDMEDDWKAFIQVHKDAKPFKNHGWVHLDKMAQLMPSAIRGGHVFRPSQGVSGIDTSIAANDAPEEDDASHLGTPIAWPPSPPAGNEENEEEMPTQTTENVPCTPPHGPVASASTARKRERAMSETPAQSQKRSKATGAEAIQGLTVSISRFGDNICKVLAMDPSLRTPHRRKEAMKLAQQETWLSNLDRLVFCTVLEKDINAVDAYSSLELDDVEFRHMWIQQKVDDAKDQRNGQMRMYGV